MRTSRAGGPSEEMADFAEETEESDPATALAAWLRFGEMVLEEGGVLEDGELVDVVGHVQGMPAGAGRGEVGQKAGEPEEGGLEKVESRVMGEHAERLEARQAKRRGKG